MQVENPQDEAKRSSDSEDEGKPGCCLKASVILLVIVFLLSAATASAASWVVHTNSDTPTDRGTYLGVGLAGSRRSGKLGEHPLGSAEELLADLYSQTARLQFLPSEQFP